MKNLFKAFKSKKATKKQTENYLIQLAPKEEKLVKFWDNFDRSLYLDYKREQID